MKQTNSAIKFLMAQYRAIFKNAYFKGLVSATVLTAGLSAGQASAAYDLTNVTDINEQQEATLVIDNDDTFQVSGTTTGNEISKNITINSAQGSSGLHQFTLQGDNDFSVTSDNTFTVNSTGVMNFGTSGETNKGILQVHFDTYDFKSGSTVNIYANAHTGTGGSSGNRATIVDGDTINIAGTLSLKSNNGSNAVLQGDNINITSGAFVTLDSSSGTQISNVIGKAVLGFTPSSDASGSIIDVDNAKLVLISNTAEGNNGGQQRSSAQIWGSSLTLTDSSFTVSGAGTTTENFKLTGSSHLQTHTNVFNNSTIYLASGANLNINPQEIYSSAKTYAYINGTVDINGGVVALGGDLVLNRGGTLRVSDDTKLFAIADSSGASNPFINPQGSIAIGIEHSIANAQTQKDFTGSTNPTLEISSKTLSAFFSGDGSEHNVVAADGSGTTVTDHAGKVILTDGARVKFTDTGTVTISDYSFGVYTTAADPAPKKGTSANFYAYQASETGEIGSQDDKMDASIRMYATNMAIEKSLIPSNAAGGDEVNSSQQIIFEADNLTLGSSGFNSSTNALGIKSATAKNVNFVAYSSDDTFVLKEKLTLRSITGSDLDVADNGTIQGNVTLSGSSGTLTVDGGKYTSNGDVTISNSALNVININGADVSTLTFAGDFTLDNATGANTVLVSGSGAVLDISAADIVVSGSGTEGRITTFTVNSSGTMITDGENVTEILKNDTGRSGSAIYLSNGTLKVTDSLTLEESQLSANTPAASNKIVFDNTASTNETLSVAETLTINAAATSPNGTVSLDNTVAVSVGSLMLNNASGSENAKVSTLAGGEYTVLNGLTTKNSTDTVKLEGTTLNLGKLSDDGQTVSGGGSLANLDLDSTSNVSVYGSWSGSKLTTESGAQLTVNSQGSLTLAGTTNTTDPTVEKSGLNLAADTINLAGNLILGNGVAEDISVTTSGTVTAEGITKGAIDIQGGTLRIEFDSGDSFNSDQLTALKEYLFSGSADGAINGVLHLGNGKIEGIDLSKEETVDETGRYDYDLIAGVAGVESDVTNNDLTEHAFTTSEPSKVSGIIGGLHVTGTTSSVTLQNTAGFVNTEKNNGFFVSVTDGSGKEVAADITFNGSVLRLENGGEAGDVTLSGASGSELIVRSTEKETVLGNVSGSSGGTFTVQGSVKAQDVNIKNVSIAEGNTLQANSFKVAEAVKTTVLDGNLVVSSTGTGSKSGSAEFAGEAVLNGQNVIGKDLTANKGLTINNTTTVGADLEVSGDAFVNGDTKVAGTATFDKEATVAGGAHFVASKVVLSGSGSVLNVGQDDNAVEEISGSNATFQADTLELNGGTFVVDPSYNQAASIAIINKLVGSNLDATYDGGSLNGNMVAAQNSIVALGVTDSTANTAIDEIKEVFADLFTDHGSLNEEKVGSILYVGKNVNVENGSKIIADANLSGHETVKEITGTNGRYNQYDAYIGKNSAIAIDEDALVTDGKGAVHFDTQGAILFNNGGKVLLVGDGFNTRDSINLFTDLDANNQISGVLISGSNLRVETLNGLFGFTYASGSETYARPLELNTEQIDFVFNDASAPVKNTLISYAARDNNWDRGADENAVDTDTLHGSLAKGIKYDGSKFTKTDDSTTGVDQSAYVKVEYTDGDGKTQYHVYHAAFNSFLDYVTTHEMTGRSAEQVARLGVYGGAAQAALSAGATTYDAISGRMGVGAQYGSITFADNGQGAGLWLAPIYKSHDSDGFASQGPSYGVDMSMYGLALGGDFTMSNGLRVGGAFNLGSGDADGQSMAAGVSNDFSYVGFSVYGGFSMDKLSIVGDISYTIVDNDVEANTTADKVSTSFDSSSLSVGLTGQYALDVNGLSVVPHAGLRYTNVDMDDYTVKGAQYNEIAQYGADGFNVFSIPVGVTVAKEIVAGSWTVKPAFDLTLTANMGDDTVDGTVTWTGLENHATKVQSEVVDSFTYGATLGVSAKSGNMSFGFGVNYTGASSADEYGVQANARFVF